MAPQHVRRHPELKTQAPSWYKKFKIETMPKAKQKSVAEDVDEETPLHGVINEEEAKTYRNGLDKIFDNLAKISKTISVMPWN